MYQTPYHRRPRHTGSYFLPFLSIIILGLIVVLLFQIVDYFQEKRNAALRNKAAVALPAGTAEMKLFGVDRWTAAVNGSLLHEGDVIRTLAGSRAVLTLLNGTLMRLDSETEVELTALKSRDSQDEASFALKTGQIWLKRTDKPLIRAAFHVTTDHLEVSSLGTIFSMTKRGEEAVRVISGKVQARIISGSPGDSGRRVMETIDVALGQEVSLDRSTLENIERQPLTDILTLLSDDFRSGEWYRWNRREDETGSSGIGVAQAVKQQEDAENSPLQSPPTPEPPPVQVAPAAEAVPVLTPPIIESPAESERKTKLDNMLISGSVSGATEKIEVTTYVSGKPESYFLQKYKSGSLKWNYVASRFFGNLVPGENRFTFVAFGKDGKRSDPTDLTVLYDKPREPSDLSAPKIDAFNDVSASSSSVEVFEDSVKVGGAIGKGIVKVYVNDFPLSQYVPDSGKWFYYAKTQYGNLKEGVNEYAVFGVDADGKKTPPISFSIMKKTKEPPISEDSAPASEAPASVPAASSESPPL
ncbi:FecR domain-containing protein [Candidatus Peregrinibacteria bacterium]|nr:FecR domain-containing protein [Candidatus Peregrinibacteria bacterium]